MISAGLVHDTDVYCIVIMMHNVLERLGYILCSSDAFCEAY